MTLTVELPWPSAKVHPNARGHWAPRAREIKSHRRAAYYLTMAEARQRPASTWPERIPLQFTFHPPAVRRNRDRDGMIGACKPYLDGVADALGVNDHRFELGAPRVLDPVKGGKVIVEIGA